MTTTRRRVRSPVALVGCVALAVQLGFAATVRAQTVTGVVLDAQSSAPLAGVLVSLLDLDGERVRAVLSDDAGRFAMEVGRFGRYRLRTERIGLQTTLSDTFDVFSTRPSFQRVLMGSRAIEIAGLLVDTRIRQCRVDADKAVAIQRWWQEVRTALGVSSAVQGEGLATFRIERFERAWDADLRRIVSADSREEMSLAERPFVSAESEFLSDGGYVQGEVQGQREYYAPDADVLLSDRFLAEHCFTLVEHDDDRLLGLKFEPTRDRPVTDIEGTLWVDTTTAELQSLDFTYEPVEGVPDNESGGHVSFEVLESGAWVVRDWFIRMPRLGQRTRRGRDELVLLGYTDVGGRVSPMEAVSVDRDRLGAVGAIRGVVYDSIRGRGLEGATVSIVGTSYRAFTDRRGEFILTNVPVGEHHVTFTHDDPQAWGLGSPFEVVEVDESLTSEVHLALPAFRQAARIVCLGSGQEAEAVLLGRVVDAENVGMGSASIEVSWRRETPAGVTPFTQELRTGSDGRYFACRLPAEQPLRVRLKVGERWLDAFEVTLPRGDIVYRHVRVPAGP